MKAKPIFALVFCISSILIISNAHSQETYINPESLNIETIKQEEMMGDTSRVTRVYIFIAVWNGEAYDSYAASGESDNDLDGATALDEPNDLNEYAGLMYQKKEPIKITGSMHTSYINSMPHFSELFPNQSTPFERNDLIEVDTEETFRDENYLEGTKTIPAFEASGSMGIERFIAFYNRDKEQEGLVTSFGFASVRIIE